MLIAAEEPYDLIVRSILLTLALLALGSFSVFAASPAVAVPGASVSSLRISDFAGSPIRRTVRLSVLIGACTTRVDVARLVQRRTSVQIRLTQTVPAPPVTDPPTVCPAVGIFRCVAVVLAEPLGKRPVVDLTSETRFTLGSANAPRWFPSASFKKCSPPGRVDAGSPRLAHCRFGRGATGHVLHANSLADRRSVRWRIRLEAMSCPSRPPADSPRSERLTRSAASAEKQKPALNTARRRESGRPDRVCGPADQPARTATRPLRPEHLPPVLEHLAATITE